MDQEDRDHFKQLAIGQPRQGKELLTLCSVSKASEMANLLISGYPNTVISDPEYYISQVVEILIKYDEALVQKACRASGIPADFPKFLPTVGEINNWLVGQNLTETEKFAQSWELRAKAQLEAREEWERQREEARLSYEELKAKYGDGKGGWIGRPQYAKRDSKEAHRNMTAEQKKAALESAAKVGREFAEARPTPELIANLQSRQGD